MRRLVLDAKKDPHIRQLAIQLTNDLPQKDFRGEIDRLFAYVRDQIRYVGDIHDIETLQTPARTLEWRAGDCDDKSVLLAALLETINHPARFKAAGVRGGPLSHVYVQTKLGARWISLDPTMPRASGWEPPDVTLAMYCHI